MAIDLQSVCVGASDAAAISLLDEIYGSEEQSTGRLSGGVMRLTPDTINQSIVSTQSEGRNKSDQVSVCGMEGFATNQESSNWSESLGI